MNKKYLFIISFAIFAAVLLLISSCGKEKTTQEKQLCFQKCMKESKNKASCLSNCDLTEQDLKSRRPQAVCGDNKCFNGEEGTCLEDCPDCRLNSDCSANHICEENVCTYVECKEDSECSSGDCQDYICAEIVIVEEIEEEEEVTIVDSDSDGISDEDDICDGIDDTIDDDNDDTPDCIQDSDEDGLTDYEENYVYDTEADDDDSDSDGLEDGDEVEDYETDPNDSDSDGDGYSDYDELKVYETDPNDDDEYPIIEVTETDSDADGLTDTEEATYGTDANDTDSDDDGYSDYDEIKTYGTTATDATSYPVFDSDGDGLTDTEEATYGTDASDTDSDDDNLSDYDEVTLYSSDPNVADTCVETDGGNDIYEKGMLAGYTAASDTSFQTYEDSCSSDGSSVVELYCLGGYGVESTYTCANGCSEGACVSS